MIRFKTFFSSAILLIAAVSQAHGDLVTIMVEVDAPIFSAGDSVDWRILATVSNVSNDNFGIATLAVNLNDSRNDVLSPATAIGAPFSDYFTFNGQFEVSTSTLLEITASLSSQNSSLVEGISPAIDPNSNLGPLLLASGSYRPTIGSHELAASAGSANLFFTAAGQLNGAGTRDFDLAFQPANFVVSAVPEPSSLMMFSVGVVVMMRRRRSAIGKSISGT